MKHHLVHQDTGGAGAVSKCKLWLPGRSGTAQARTVAAYLKIWNKFPAFTKRGGKSVHCGKCSSLTIRSRTGYYHHKNSSKNLSPFYDVVITSAFKTGVTAY